MTAPSHSTSGSQAGTQATSSQTETGAAAEYSRIGPSYETIVNSSHALKEAAASGGEKPSLC